MRRPGGFSILELVIAIAILSMAVYPVVTNVTTAQRIGVSARRMYEVTSGGQVILESITQLGPTELPRSLVTAAPDQDVVLLETDNAPATSPSPRWKEVVEFFANGDDPGSYRKVTGKKLPSGAFSIRIELKWLRIGHDKRTEQELVLTGLCTPRTWQPLPPTP